MAGLCKYSNALGEPDKGVHALRIGGLAAVDLLLTAGLAYLVSRHALGCHGVLAFLLVFVMLILVAVALHEAFCVNTRLNALIFGRAWPGPYTGAIAKQ
jgi:hypothetical protein